MRPIGSGSPANAHDAAHDLQRVDPVWEQVRAEATAAMRAEPAMGGFIYATVLHHDRLEHAVAHRLAQRLTHPDVDAGLLSDIFRELLVADPGLGDMFRADLTAVLDRDPACTRLIEPLLYFKGFHGLQTHRFAHLLLKAGRRDIALYLQSQASRVFSMDINPAARIGRGVFIDHGHALVIGETAVVGDNVSLLHSVTLGGTGKESGDRHPKIGDGVLIGAGAKVLGNITIGHCTRIAAGSVVLMDVPPRKTVAGVPARIVGDAACLEPSRTMDHRLQTVVSDE
jgi:serine O-acetyltransferase